MNSLMLRALLLTAAVVVLPGLVSGVEGRAADQRSAVWANVNAAAMTGQPATEAAPEHAEEAGAEEEHTETIWGPIARLFNAVVLFGILYYFLRGPIAAHLQERSAGIRSDLVTAEETKRSAAAQIATLEAKMAALPAELETLKIRGHEEIAAEEARIEQTAAAERERLLEQTRREIDLQLRVARRELIEHAANLAVGVATDRIKKDIRPEDQARLAERYLQQVKP